MNQVKINLPPIYKRLRNNHRYKILYGGRGGARSWTIARILLLLAGQNKIRILCTREFQHSIKDSVHKLLSDQIGLMKLSTKFIILKDKIVSSTGSEFLFAGLKHNTTSIKSMEGIDICWVEEAEKVSEDSWDILIPTIRKAGSEIWISFNPDLETDPTYKRFVLNTPPESLLIKATWRDNPWFPDELLKEKDYMYTVDPERALWIWEGECRSHSDAQIMKGKWVIDTFEPDKFWYGPYFGADWGFARDPSVLIKFWIAPSNEYFDIMIEKEAYGIGVDISDTPDLFDKIEGSREHPIYADNARPETINHMIKAGFSMIAAPKWPGCVEDGIAWIRSCRKIVIHESCKHLTDEAKNYSYKIDKLTGDILPQVQKGYDHCFVGNTKVLTNLGEIQIKGVKPGAYVMTSNGWKKVIFNWNNGVKKTFKYELQFDTFSLTLQCTDDHKIKTLKGWKKARELSKGDELYIHKHLMKKYIACTQKRGTIHHTATDYMSMYGNTLMAKFLMVIMFITKMVIKAITKFQIYALYMGNYIVDLSQKECLKTTLNIKENLLTPELRLQSNGINQRMGLNGIRNTQKTKDLANLRMEIGSAKFACVNMLRNQRVKDSAQIIVNQNIEDKQGLIVSLKHAKDAGKNLKQTNLSLQKIVHVNVVGSSEEKVYDLSIEDTHEYFANGVLVSNCWDAIRYGATPFIFGDANYSESMMYNESVNISPI